MRCACCVWRGESDASLFCLNRCIFFLVLATSNTLKPLPRVPPVTRRPQHKQTSLSQAAVSRLVERHSMEPADRSLLGKPGGDGAALRGHLRGGPGIGGRGRAVTAPCTIKSSDLSHAFLALGSTPHTGKRRDARARDGERRRACGGREQRADD